jgi:hypothetical protein
LAGFFVVDVPDARTANRVIDTVSTEAFVDRAYVKPPASPAWE